MMGSGGLRAESRATEEYRQRAFGRFWEGYRRFRQPDCYCLSQIAAFLQYRRCLLYIVLQNEVAKDPAWQRRFKERIRTEDAAL